MPFIASRFNVREFNQGETSKQYGTYIMGEFATALLATSASWSLYESLVDVGPSSGTTSLTSQLFFSSKSNEYLRVWCYSGKNNGLMNIVTTDTQSSSSWYVHLNNLMKFTYSNSSNFYVKTFGVDRLMFFFAVSDNYIGSDLGYDLGLKTPIFAIKSTDTSYTNNSPAFWMEYPFYSSFAYSYTIISDGTLFGVIARFTSSSQGKGSVYNAACLYANDMIVPADPNDKYTWAVINSSATSASYFYVSENYYNDNSPSEYRAFFSDSNGSFDFRGCYYPTYYVDTRPARTSDSSNKIVTVPMSLFVIPYYQAASTLPLANNGVGLKGWTNPDYIRFVNSEYMPSVNRGVKYRNGEFICTGKSTLICWDDNNPNPFDA